MANRAEHLASKTATLFPVQSAVTNKAIGGRLGAGFYGTRGCHQRSHPIRLANLNAGVGGDDSWLARLPTFTNRRPTTARLPGHPPAQVAYDQLWVNGRPSRALAETVVLAVCLTSGYYLVGSLGSWLYYGSRTLLANQQQSAEPQQLAWLAPTTAHLWQNGTACVVATTTLQPGDQVILQSGEQAPVDGLITKGVAWLRSQASFSTACGQREAIGDRVAAADLVLVGRICVQMLATA